MHTPSLKHKILSNLKNVFWRAKSIGSENTALLLGKLASNQIKTIKSVSMLSDVEFKVFSQFGDDGIIQWLINNIEIPNKTFIEFGVENYRESNTRFLMMNDNWSGFVMDGCKSNITQIINSEYFWRYELLAKAAFIDKENINELLAIPKFDNDVGLLHIDIDGNDYWIWEAINNTSPIILIIEYNSVFGVEKSITVPYDSKFVCTQAHHSNLYFGASLPALCNLCTQKGYRFIGCNSAGNNAYFIRNDKLNDIVKPVSIEQGYVASKFRQSRNTKGELTHLKKEDQLTEIKGMPVYNTLSKCIEAL
jgi:hypothetical protein